MCGIAGFKLSNSFADPQQVLSTMTGSLAHRGPDNEGFWSDQQSGIYLGHRRLAIQDLSATGHQPMASASSRFVIVYNGELYNHIELRQQLSKTDPHIHWKGTSDTETLLACFDLWGVEATLQCINGMFAIA